MAALCVLEPICMLAGVAAEPAERVAPTEVTFRLPVLTMFAVEVTARAPVVVTVPRFVVALSLIVNELLVVLKICPRLVFVVPAKPNPMAEAVVFAVTFPVTFRFLAGVEIAPLVVPAVSERC